jgi:hypothetical protein
MGNPTSACEATTAGIIIEDAILPFVSEMN